jgi:6-phosphogluconolactonase/glucosamine-6-phosphate isomerase/deaminase
VAAAELLVSLISSALIPTDDAQASLVVSGGASSGPCFDLLFAERLDWSRVTVLPSVPGSIV